MAGEPWGVSTKKSIASIQLLRMGIEFLQEGGLHVHRHDAQELLDIKVGKYRLEQIKSLAEELFKQAEQAHERCRFPDEPDELKVNELLKHMLVSHFGVIHIQMKCIDTFRPTKYTFNVRK